MRKILGLILIIAFAASAQQVNWRGLQDTVKFSVWCKDSLFISKAFILSTPDKKCDLFFVFDDTSHAARKSDSVNAAIGYELGCPIVSLAGVLDTTWSPWMALDTCNTIEGIAKEYDPSKTTATAASGAIDTTIGTSSSSMAINFTPTYSPLIRFYAKGLASNLTTKPIKAKFVFVQRAYDYVRQM